MYNVPATHFATSSLRTSRCAGALLDRVDWPSDVERLVAILLDSELRPIRTAWLADGSRSAVEVDIRRLVATALAEDASAMILAHNHPGGSSVVSMTDRRLTADVFRVLKTVRVRLIDHLIRVTGRWVSMRDEGYL